MVPVYLKIIYLMVFVRKKTHFVSSPGARFSKVPKSFRTRKAVAKSLLFFTLELIYSYIHNTKRSSLRTRSIHLSGLKHRLAKSAWLFGPEKIQGLSRNGLPERLVKKLKVYSIPRIFFWKIYLAIYFWLKLYEFFWAGILITFLFSALLSWQIQPASWKTIVDETAVLRHSLTRLYLRAYACFKAPKQFWKWSDWLLPDFYFIPLREALSLSKSWRAGCP